MRIKVMVSLYDYTGHSCIPWAEDGYVCYAVDIKNTGKIIDHDYGRIVYLRGDLRDEALVKLLVALNPCFISAFPPCTDLAVSGARHFAEKAKADPNYQKKAMDLVYIARSMIQNVGCPGYLENPVSRISTLYRKPDYIFNPYQYGKYTTRSDPGLAPHDGYIKKTCIWGYNGFAMPAPKPVPITHKNIIWCMSPSNQRAQLRSQTPMGFARAVYAANCPA